MDYGGSNRPAANGRSSLPTFIGGKSLLSTKRHLEIRRQPSFEQQHQQHDNNNNQSNGAARRSALPVLSPVNPTFAGNNRSSSPSPYRSNLPRPQSSASWSSAQPQKHDLDNVMSNGQYMPLHEAMRRSPLDNSESEESSARGSPSPAPREHLDGIRSRDTKSHYSKIPLNLGRRPSSRQSTGGGAVRDDDSQASGGSSPDGRSSRLRQPTQYSADKDRVQLGGGGTVFSKSRVGGVAHGDVAGRELLRKASSSSLDGRRFGSWGVKGQLDPNFKRRLMSPDLNDTPSRDPDVPLPSIETAPVNSSPEKSFAWGADADFTAGDLQVSDSPPVKVQPDARLGLQGRKSFQPIVRSNTRIDEIRRLENELKLKNYDEPELCQVDPEVEAAAEPEPATRKPIIYRTNTKLEELRIKELALLSNKTIAKEKLDEIRRRNSASRSLSPEAYGKAHPGFDENVPEQPNNGQEDHDDQGEVIPDTPVVIYRGGRRKTIGGVVNENDNVQEAEKEASKPNSTSHTRKDSHDLLRRLARAASSSPSPETQPAKVEDPREDNNKEPNNGLGDRKEINGPTATILPHSTDVEHRGSSSARQTESSPDEAKAFAGMESLRKVTSVTSSEVSSKRSSATWESSDPAERIAAEMQLFAPREDAQSERGASAPDSELEASHDSEETPRAKRQDPLMMPTPRAPGAYVETPATVKVQDISTGHRSKGPAVEGKSVFKRPQTMVEAKATGDGDEPPAGRSSSVSSSNSSSSSRRRAKSRSHTQSPLVNSVKLPSAKDDLLEIQKQLNDDTLDLWDMLPEFKDSDGEEVVEKQKERQEFKIDHEPATRHESKAEDEAGLKVLGVSVQRALLEVQDSRKGIDRLIEVTEANAIAGASQDDIMKRLQVLENSHRKPSSSSSKSRSTSDKGGAVKPTRYIKSWFWHQGRPSWLCRFLILAVIWALLETATCRTYCRPSSCSPGQDCSWTPADPFPGYSLPVKLDEWATGGKGRVLFEHLTEEIGDLVEDAKEAVMGLGGDGGSGKKEANLMSWEERRRYRRRLVRRGLVKQWSPPTDYLERFQAWGKARRERERATSMREMGYNVGDGLGGDSINDDERMS